MLAGERGSLARLVYVHFKPTWLHLKDESWTRHWMDDRYGDGSVG